MDINSKFIYAKTKTAFEREIPNIPENLKPIVFIEDTREMWTCGTYFSIGYPAINVTETNSIVSVGIGNTSFSLASSGESLSIKKGVGNNIIITSNALSKVNTEEPLHWDVTDKKLLHSKVQGLLAGSYGQSSQLDNASTFSIPYITVNEYGHIISISSKNIDIRDYVDQLRPIETGGNKNILLSYNEENDQSDTAQVRKARGLTYNDGTQILSVGGGIDVSGRVNINGGDITVTNGQIVGDLKGNVTGSATPKIHISALPEYGGASKQLYGHVKLQDELGVTAPLPSSENVDVGSSTIEGIAASPLMVWNTKKDLESKITSAVNGISGIGGITIGEQSIEITTPRQIIEIEASNGITASIVEGVISFKGVEIKGHDDNGIEKLLTNNLTLGTDFTVDETNNASIRWVELN